MLGEPTAHICNVQGIALYDMELMNDWTEQYCSIDDANSTIISKCTHMVSHSQGWFCSHDVSVELVQ